jgi:L-ribulose-5-phosphate 4-epimerase
MLLENLRKECIEVGLKLLREGLVTGTMGNMSARDKESGLFTIKPAGIEYPDISLEDMVVMDLEGKIVEGKLKPSTEWPMHLLVYQERPDIHAIIHTHSPFATSFAVVGKGIPPLNGEAAAMGGTIECARFEPGGTRELGKAALESLGTRDAVILRNHGMLAVGPTMKRAMYAASITENSARLYIYGKIIGEPVSLPQKLVDEIRDEYQYKYFQR